MGLGIGIGLGLGQKQLTPVARAFVNAVPDRKRVSATLAVRTDANYKDAKGYCKGLVDQKRNSNVLFTHIRAPVPGCGPLQIRKSGQSSTI